MHWLIPVATHSVSSLYALLGQTITPAALGVSIALVAAQSFHLWGGFYVAFAVFFITSIASITIARFNGTSTSKRTAKSLLANALLAASLVPLHHYYLKRRLTLVKWFHIHRAPAGCLPIPSPGFTYPMNYTPLDALANQLPWGIVASYAAATASSLNFALGGKKGLSIFNISVASLGATVVALAAGHMLPMCDGRVPGAEEVMQSVDRSVAWEERTEMTWSDQARYQKFPAFLTLIGIITILFEDAITRQLMKKSATPKSKVAGADSKSKNPAAKSNGQKDSADTLNLASFYTNALITSSVIIGMAGWSYLSWGLIEAAKTYYFSQKDGAESVQSS